MPCYSMMVAGVAGTTENGKRRLQFLGKATSYDADAGRLEKKMLLPCRQCIGCRLERSRQWATRLMHESTLHQNACFLTLTYDDNQIPIDGSLNPTHLGTFIKDLRARCNYYGKGKLKYFACGEYGDKTSRPHYHLALYGPFGVHEIDHGRSEQESARSGARQFTHSDIGEVWPYGLHRYSELSYESAAYVARYVLKKVSGADAQDHYGTRHPEFQRQSNGLGKEHFARWCSDIYPADHVVLPGRGAFMPPPYYDRLLEKVDPDLFQKVKKAREDAREKMNRDEVLHHVNDRVREGEVKTIVTDQTLKREGYV